MRSVYTYYFVHEVLVIIDQLGMKSVTNDIENVLADIHIKEGINLTGRQIIYKDSAGVFDGVKAEDIGGSAKPLYRVSFYPIREMQIDQALKRVL